jgi:hypothetical protein
MSKLQLRAFLYQLGCFACLFILARFLVERYSGLTGFWVPFIAFVIGTFLSPKFQAVKTNDGEKLYMKWVFSKNVKEIG